MGFWRAYTVLPRRWTLAEAGRNFASMCGALLTPGHPCNTRFTRRYPMNGTLSKW